MNREKERIARSGIMPNEEQTTLLKACLLSAPESIQAFHSWLEKINISVNLDKEHRLLGLPQFFDPLDLASQRLLSMLYKNMKANHVNHPVVSKLEGYYKYVWYRNQVLMGEFRKLASLLADEEIKVVLRKGLYMTIKVYEDFGARPSVDMDITVRKDDWLKAVLILENNGWSSKERSNPYRMSISQAHAHAFKKGGFELDLHYDFENYGLKEETTGQMWSHLFEEDGFNCLSKSNELYLTLIHGFIPNHTISPIRWVVDCVLLFHQFNESDWSDLTQLISEERKKRILIMLDYLRVNEFISFPASFQEQLNQMEGIPFDYVERAILAKFSVNGFWVVRYLWANIFVSNSKSLSKSLTKAFNHYLYAWDKRTYWDVVLHGATLFSDKFFNPNRKRLSMEKK